MPWRGLIVSGLVLAGCFTPPKCAPGAPLVAVDGGWACGSTSRLTITEHLCDGGTTTFHVPNQSGGALNVHQQCGSPATVSVVEATSVLQKGGDDPETPALATVHLPAGFDPAKGDMVAMMNVTLPHDDPTRTDFGGPAHNEWDEGQKTCEVRSPTGWKFFLGVFQSNGPRRAR